ncbi:uncharacterized protein LOC117288034 [Asterias rubens]|uniref:uncharacterized protein LOC117288034 n=1 Tax=Asterias rubens TaxID=7604 RepID=UPI0014551A5B|nr:uncharacterized protein LOC117288034 [Asterias rubens]
MASDWRRSRRFSDDWVPPPSLVPFLKDDDDDDDYDFVHTERLIETTTTMTPELGFEFITVPGRGARPLASYGSLIAATVVALLVLLTLAISIRWRRKRHSVTDDEVPMSVITGEDGRISWTESYRNVHFTPNYSPYNVETDGLTASSVYTQLDQPADRRFPNVRTSRVSSQLAMRTTSVHCDYDEPQPVVVNQVRSRPHTNRISDYDEPDFSLVNGAASGVLVSGTSIGALGVTQPDEAYYSSLQEMGGRVSNEAAATRQNDVYYSSIKSNEKVEQPTTVIGEEVKGSDERTTRAGEQRPFYFTLERSANNRPIRSSEDGDEEAVDDHVGSDDDEDTTIKYDYLQLTTKGANASDAPVYSTCRNARTSTTDYLKLADSHSGLPDVTTTTAPTTGDSGPVEGCAGKDGGSQGEIADAENVYNTLQRRKRSSTATNTEEIYNVLFLE